MNIIDITDKLKDAPRESQTCAGVDGRQYQLRFDGHDYCLNLKPCPLQKNSYQARNYCLHTEYHREMAGERK